MTTPPDHAPESLTKFIGRERELHEVGRILEGSRLVTITGIGGTGKTRLAAELVRRRGGSAPGRVCWVELAPLAHGELLMEHLAACLRSQQRPDRPLLDSLIDSLNAEPCLLVLDNCEHLVEACAALIDRLLRRCPTLVVLATSREALGIEGEHAWLLRGLSLGAAASDGEPAAGNEAAEFFIDRAGAVSTRFNAAANREAIARICRRLDGIPLAIGLAASRVGVLTVGEIDTRLDDLFRLLPSTSRTSIARHRTLSATVEWSYRLISDEERLLLHRISVFAGTFSLEAAESVCADSALPAERVLDALAGLVTRSLVSMHEDMDPARYVLPEFIRQYAAEQLRGDPVADSMQQQRHAEFFATLAETALAELERSHSPAWIARLDADYDNLRSALSWSFAARNHVIALRLTGSLGWYWAQIWQLAEWHSWLDQALNNPPPVATREWGLVLNGAGSQAYMHGDLDRARPLLEQAAETFHQCSDGVHEVVARATLANLLASSGDIASAIDHGERAAAIARALPDSWPLGHAMSNGLAFALARAGQRERADDCLREAEEHLARKGAHAWGALEVARARAALAIAADRLPLARQQVRIAIEAAVKIQRPHSMFRVLVVAQRLLCALGIHVAAARLQAVLGATHMVGMAPFPDDARLQAETREILTRTLGEARTLDLGRTPVSETLTQTLQQVLKELATEPATNPPSQRPDEVVTAQDLRVKMLGRVEVIVSGTRLPPDTWRQTKLLELLAYLLLHRQGCTRDQIGAALWPDASSAQVKNNFHVLLHKLRRQLVQPDLVIVAADKYSLNPTSKLWFDAAAFEAAIVQALRERGHSTCPQLGDALPLYEGDLLEGVEVGDWCSEYRERLREIFLDGLTELADRHIASGDHPAAIVALRELVRRDVQREEASRRLMQVLADSGNRDAAIAHYRQLTARLREELAVSPSVATTALARTLAGSDRI